MNKANFVTYEGSEPYIFISYAHKDSDRVCPILDELAGRGYRIWYDDGIAPGSEWPEYIAEHLNNSDVVLAFISPNSIASSNCRREITFALSKKKKFIAIVLEETEMSLGMEMQLSAQQSILKYNYTTEEFYRKLCDAPDLALSKRCLTYTNETSEEIESAESGEAVQTAVAMDDTAAAANNVTESAPSQKNAISSEDMEAVAHMEQLVTEQAKEQKVSQKEQKASQKEQKADRKAEHKAERKTAAPAAKAANGKKSKVPLILLSILGVVVLLIIVDLSLKAGMAIKFEDGTKVGRDAQTITVRNVSITQENLNKIGKMKNLRDITFKNCEVTGDLSTLKNAGNIRTLDLENTKVSNYAFLKKMPNLMRLNLNGGTFSDVDAPALKDMEELYNLSLLNNGGFTAIDVIPMEKMTSLVLDGTGIQSIDAISGCETLRTLSISYTKVKEIKEPIKYLRLQYLEMMGLSELSDLSAFENLTQLKELKVAGCKATNFAWIDQSKDSLVVLDASGLAIDDETFGAIANCKKMTELYLNAVPMDNLSFVSKMKELNTLKAANCGLNDVSAVGGLNKLRQLWLNGNQIEAFKSSSTELKELNIAHNKIKDLSNIPSKCSKLAVYDNPADLNSLGARDYAEVLAADYDDVLIKNQKIHSYSRIYIVGTPANKLVDMEDFYHGFKDVTEEELDHWIEESRTLNYSEWK